MIKKRKNSIERIGRQIYPLRVFGLILFSISIVLSQSKLGLGFDAWSIIAIAICLIYPHIGLLWYLKDECRETEIKLMQIDMALVGVLIGVINFNPAIALPYLIANSAANYALRGMKQVVHGLSLVFITTMLVFIFRDQPAVTQADSIELLSPFLYLIIVTHYMGHLSYMRGVSLLRRKIDAEETSKLDFLTGLNNRRSMFDKARLNDKDPKANDHDTTLIMADVDHFKRVNDTHGHNHGDAVLIQVSELIKSSLRGTDVVARWGGEEFLVLLTKTNIEQGVSVAENIRETIANKPFIYDGVEHKVTLTLGIATYGANSNFEETIQRADKALYEGKESGRNRVVTFDPALV
ncbi:sensor domain-containing diguanylate cyclase [Leucothrix arctica]|uniref:diguanylate cyclase n=1 Tax=Leucothrix arctica TaxID=1481894 RepID=A0A317C5N8_9GAMM|nr:sensor domain-containing diguanylate cyclase [Leucothrix arctica]PWQ93531.1 hypothetical protein DKT75_18095 [Leucothrix arctica]